MILFGRESERNNTRKNKIIFIEAVEMPMVKEKNRVVELKEIKCLTT